MKPVIKAVNLKKNYTSGNYKTEAVKNVSVDIYPGEKIAITGPSGCGKTTLLNMIGLVIKPTGGEIFIDGENTIDLSDKKCAEYRNKLFGYVVQ